MMRSLLQLLIAALGLVTLQAAGIRAQLSTQEVAGGQGALLSLTVEGGKPDQAPVLPQIENLVINPRGQSTQVQMVNGTVTRSVVYTYVVGSYTPGEYVIPAISVSVGGQQLASLPLKLKVRQGAADPAGGQGGEGETKEDEAKRYGYLTFELVKKDRDYVYPGEIAPVRIKAYFPLDASVSLKSLPRPEGSAFTLHNLSSEPEQTRESVDGKGYLVVTWYGGLSATKVGKYPARLTIEGTVAMRDRSGGGGGGRRGAADPFFGGSIFDDLMGPMIPKEVTLTTPEAPDLEVRDLPTEGRPEDFSGAIGQFQFDRLVIPDSLSTGEPCRFEAQISGNGNFALLKEPQPLPAENWKVYHGTADFTPQDVASFSGQKAFRYSAVPLTPGEQEVSLGFSYFDPDLGEYKTVKSTPRQVVIAGKAIAPFPTASAGSTASAPPPPPSGPRLAPLKESLGSLGAYRPLSATIWFVPALAGCLLAAVGLGGFSAWRRRHEAPALRQRRALEAALQGALANAAHAVQAGDAAGFFAAARDAVRIQVAGQSGIKPEAVTLADVTRDADAGVAELLREADRWDYSGGSTLPVGDLRSWHEKLLQCLGRATGEAIPRAA